MLDRGELAPLLWLRGCRTRSLCYRRKQSSRTSCMRPKNGVWDRFHLAPATFRRPRSQLLFRLSKLQLSYSFGVRGDTGD